MTISHNGLGCPSCFDTCGASSTLMGLSGCKKTAAQIQLEAAQAAAAQNEALRLAAIAAATVTAKNQCAAQGLEWDGNLNGLSGLGGTDYFPSITSKLPTWATSSLLGYPAWQPVALAALAFMFFKGRH